MTRRSIPTVPRSDKARMDFDAAVKERLEVMGGERGEKIRLLPADASLAEAVAKVNELIARMQQ